MSDSGIKLTYNQALARVRLKLSCETAKQLPKVPDDILERTHTKMKSEKAKNNILQYFTYTKHLEHVIARAKVADFEDDPRWRGDIHLTLAAGIPPFQGVEIAPSDVADEICRINLVCEPKQLLRYNPKTFYLFVKFILKKVGVSGAPDPADVTLLYHKIAMGNHVESFPVSHHLTKKDKVAQGLADIMLLPITGHNAFKLVLFDLNPLLGKDDMTPLFAKIESQIKNHPTPLVTWKQNIISDLALATSGIERFGLNMPLSILAAGEGAESIFDQSSSLNYSPSTPSSSEEPSAEKMNLDYKGCGLLQLDVADDQMSATIKEFKLSFYRDPNNGINDSWLKNEIQRLGLKNLATGFIQRATDSIRKQRDLSGLEIALGEMGIAAGKPKIVPISEVDGEQPNNENEKINPRTANSKMQMVAENETIAKLIFTSKPIPGKNIFGIEVPPPEPQLPELEIGEDVEILPNQCFISKIDGIMKIDHLKINVIKTYIHNGDVNLNTGNIYFDGPIIINGNIDKGAEVYSTKDIHIKEQVRGGIVEARGDIKVDKGIITGKSGKIICRGDLDASYIENSMIRVGGNLKVRRAILSSELECLGNIHVSQLDGMLAGCNVSIWGNIVTGELGFAKGRDTIVKLGSDWRLEKRVEIKQGRLERFTKDEENFRNDYKELARRSKAQMTKKHLKQKDDSFKKSKRLQAICEKLEDQIMWSKDAIVHNKDAYIMVNKTMYQSCIIQYQDNEIPIPPKLEGIAIFATPLGGKSWMEVSEFKTILKKRRSM